MGLIDNIPDESSHTGEALSGYSECIVGYV